MKSSVRDYILPGTDHLIVSNSLLRIGLVTGEFPPMEGGVGAFTEQLALALSKLGHEVHVIAPTQSRPVDAPRRSSSNNPPIATDYGFIHPRTGRWRWSTMSIVADIAIRSELDIINEQYQAAAYNMNSPAPNFLPWRLKSVLPVVVTFHDLRPPYLLPKAGSMRERTLQFMAQQARGNIATNAADFATLETWAVKSARCIPIGSNIDVYHPNHIEIAEAREQSGLSEGDIMLGYFGFLNESKGGQTLIEALATLDNRFHLVFIGGQTGDSDQANNQAYLAEIRQQIELAGMSHRVHWTGYLAPTRVSTYLGASDMIVMPYRDGASLRRGTLMAALAHGRPVISTVPSAETPEFQDGVNMVLVQPDDAVALAEAIGVLAADPERRRKLGEGAATLSGRFSWDTIGAQTADYFGELVAADRARMS